ncbi:hypothetical protein [Novipirellula caenicola]|uniref:hypothetical protein n=1 Tax=Novipirellula caenicola TaxID=1536901 RepID=UPI0031EE52DD
MMIALIKAIIGVSIILGGWLWVQNRWRIVTGAASDVDVLAGRIGCHGCGCKMHCENLPTHDPTHDG